MKLWSKSAGLPVTILFSILFMFYKEATSSPSTGKLTNKENELSQRVYIDQKNAGVYHGGGRNTNVSIKKATIGNIDSTNKHLAVDLYAATNNTQVLSLDKQHISAQVMSQSEISNHIESTANDTRSKLQMTYFSKKRLLLRKLHSQQHHRPADKNVESHSDNSGESPRNNSDESPRENGDESDRDDSDESHRENNDESPRDNSDESHREKNDESPRDNSDESHREKNDESPTDRNDESPRDRNDESPGDRNDESLRNYGDVLESTNYTSHSCPSHCLSDSTFIPGQGCPQEKPFCCFCPSGHRLCCCNDRLNSIDGSSIGDNYKCPTGFLKFWNKWWPLVIGIVLLIAMVALVGSLAACICQVVRNKVYQRRRSRSLSSRSTQSFRSECSTCETGSRREQYEEIEFREAQVCPVHSAPPQNDIFTVTADEDMVPPPYTESGPPPAYEP